MSIKKRLYISFSLILSIIIFIIGVFFYTIFNLNKIHNAQKLKYEQILSVEKLKEFNNSFSWIVLDIVTDYEKVKVVKDRLNKANELFNNLNLLKNKINKNIKSAEEKKSFQKIYSSFETIEKSINNKLFTLVLSKKEQNSFEKFNIEFEKVSKNTEILLVKKIEYLKNKLEQTEKNRYEFIETIKIELVIILFIAFLLSFIIASKIVKEIKDMLYKLNKGVLQLFNNNEKIIKVDLGKNNELSEITNTLNSYLEKQDDIIYSREELLRNISHELKTPISKGKFLIESLKKDSNKNEILDIDKVLLDIEELTSKLLEREKLNFATLNLEKFKISSLILDSLSKLSIDDETKVEIDIEDDIYLEGDKYYLTIALKNLIDNAIKYALEFPIKIEAHENKIMVKNISKKLSKNLIYYTQPFTREPNQQQGHGLGLNIVNKIVNLHGFKLEYEHIEPYNILSIYCQDKGTK